MSVSKILSQLDARELSLRRVDILSRLTEFARVPQTAWQREIALCLLTPQTSPVKAENAMRKLETEGLFTGSMSQEKISKILRDPQNYIRFHNVKATNLARFVLNISEVISFLRSGKDPSVERAFLTKHIRGFGPKEASHALRNIGRRNLAILDRHILRELYAYRVIATVPASISMRRYLELEESFRRFADRCGEELDVLDLFFWSKRTGFIFK